MERSMEEFLHRRNVARYRRLLLQAPDASRRKMLMTLLSEESTSATAHGWLFPLS